MGSCVAMYELNLNSGENNYIGFEVLTAVVKISIFWDITPYSPLKVNGRFEEICRLHFQGGRQKILLCLLPALCWILIWLI
jgi:hypothetical protein